MIQTLGPLVQYSSLRKEGKHKPFKRWARACNNYKNISKTVTERHQQQQSYVFLLRKPLTRDVEICDQVPVQVSSIDDADDLCSNIIGCALDDTVIMVQGSVHIQMYEFKPKNMVLADWLETGPVFAQVKDIVLVDNKLYFLTNLWETLFYDRHKHAYAVKESSKKLIKQPHELCLFRPLHATKTFSQTDHLWYIIVPFNLV